MLLFFVVEVKVVIEIEFGVVFDEIFLEFFEFVVVVLIV